MVPVYTTHNDNVESPTALRKETLLKVRRRRASGIIGSDLNSSNLVWRSSFLISYRLDKMGAFNYPLYELEENELESVIQEASHSSSCRARSGQNRSILESAEVPNPTKASGSTHKTNSLTLFLAGFLHLCGMQSV